MECVPKAIQDLVRAIAQYPDQVQVTALMGSANGFQVTVSKKDYALVLSKAGFIKTLAGSFAGVPEDQKIVILISPRMWI
jgi:predicted RNA-binding protein YlqC (UPF0109 family)